MKAMFCPTIGRKCKKEKCRDWNVEEGDCQVRLDRKLTQQVMDMQASITELDKLHIIGYKLIMNNLLSDPSVPDETKEIIRQALQAPSAEVADKLLREAGLMP
jgi:hypothetical protein